MRNFFMAVLLGLLPSCALLQGADTSPILEGIQQRDRVFGNQTLAFRRLVELAEQSNMPAETVAAFREGIARNEEQFRALGSSLVGLVAELGSVDWRRLYEQIRAQIEGGSTP